MRAVERLRGVRSWAGGAVVLGVVLAVATRSLYWLPGDLDPVAQLAAPWFAAAVVAGLLALDVREAALAGALALSVAVLAYYAILGLLEGSYGNSPYGVAWLLAAVPVGAVAAGGVALARARGLAGGRVAIGLACGAMAGEMAVRLPSTTPTVRFAALAAATTAVLAVATVTASSRRDALATIAVAGAVALVTPAAIEATLAGLGVVRDGA